MVLGKIGTLTVEEARALARDRLTAASQGADPSADRHAVRNAMTVGELVNLYLKSTARPDQDFDAGMDRSRIETHVKPLIGRLTVRSLTAADVHRMMAQIITGKTATPRAQTGVAVRQLVDRASLRAPSACWRRSCNMP